VPAPVPASPVAFPPVDPPAVTEGDTTLAYVNGMQVLVKHEPTAELAAIQLYIKGGVRDYAPAVAGITRLALAAATSGGTVGLDKAAFSHRLAALGSEIGSDARQDYSLIDAKTLTSAWDDTFSLLTETFLHPLLPASEIELQRRRQLVALHHEQDDPDSSLGFLTYQADYAGHPFANRPIGFLTTVPAIRAEDLAAHLATLRETGRLLLVTVGNVDPSHVLEKVKSAFGGLPRGQYQDVPFPAIRFSKPTLVTVSRKLETSYIRGDFPVPAWRDADFPAAMVAMSELSHRLFEEVRTKRNLTYAVSARLGGTSVPMGHLYVTTVDPNTTFRVMLGEVRRLQTDPVSATSLQGTKSVYLTEYLISNEPADGQASMLASAVLLGGDFRLARTLPERIRAVTPADVQAFAQRYLKNLQTVVLGDPSKVDTPVFTSL
jgi:predicted Zn-dependent peptidase